MDTTVTYICIAIIAFIIGGYIGHLTTKLKLKDHSNKVELDLVATEEKLKSVLQQKEDDIKNVNSVFALQVSDIKTLLTKTEREREELRREKEFLNTELTKKAADYNNLKIQLTTNEANFKTQQEQLRKDFELLANKILEEKSEKFTIQNKQNIQQILHPLQEKITSFEKRVDDSQKENINIHSALKEQLLGLKDLNLQMSKETSNLTKALKGDSKIQGNWGELVLERVLEKSGLEKDREYYIQQNFTLENGERQLPDVVLYLPNNKKMIIDSKVSLTSYERYVNSDSKEEQETHLKAHINSIKKHIDQLSAKNYQDLYDIESPDFVLLFIPIEPAFAIAINAENDLYNKAFDKNIVIVTPSTLLATLRTVDTMWTNEKQQRNALEIAKQAGSLYDKFEGLVTDLTNIGRKMDGAKTDYEKAMNKLSTGRGNLISNVEKLKTMGAKAKKSLPENYLDKSKED